MSIKTRFDKKNHTIYSPKNLGKYKGKLPIIMRSSWETAFARWCDHNPAVTEWSSESITIPYMHPFKKDARGMAIRSRYYPDFLIIVNNKKWLVEIKPFKETCPPKKNGNKARKTILYEQKTWKINQAKWKAANRYCKKMGWEFKIITEKQLLL